MNVVPYFLLRRLRAPPQTLIELAEQGNPIHLRLFYSILHLHVILWLILQEVVAQPWEVLLYFSKSETADILASITHIQALIISL